MQHPWIELQNIIKEKWLTQRAFSTILWKKISEVNELLKWKRNITIQWDYLLHQALWTPIKYRILKQIDYEYSLILPSSFEWKTIEETLTESDKEKIIKEKEEIQIEHISESNQNNQENINTNEEIDNDRLERARIFRSF
jgi:hypothetical protein